MKFDVIILEKVYRQNDTEFLANLEKLRTGDASCLPYFNATVKDNISPEDDAVYICSTNSAAEEYNDNKLINLILLYESIKYLYSNIITKN